MPNQNMERRTQVIEALKAYPQKKKQICLLRYELEHPAHISEEELIESLSLAKAEDGGGRSPGHISDKTMMIALQYQDAAQQINRDIVVQVSRELNTLTDELARMDYMVSLLSKAQAEVIHGFYFDEKSWTELAKELFVSPRALVKRRDVGITALVDIFEFMEQVKGGAAQ